MRSEIVYVMTRAVALLSLTACLPDYFPPKNVTRRVQTDELVGTWILTKRSVDMLCAKDLVNSETCDQTITFSASGACSFRSYSQSAETCLSANGTWNLEYGDTLAARRQKSNVLEIRLDVVRPSGKRAYERLFFTEDKGMLILWHSLGDADARIYIEYTREKEE
jgi:hypothetical protein